MPWAWLLPALSLAVANPSVEAAQKAVAELRYPEARAMLAKARQERRLDRATLIEILWLQGLVQAALNQPDAARAAFRALFAIDPDHKPSRELGPKVMQPYYEARGWIATNKPLGFQALPTERDGGRVKRIGVRVAADPLSLVVMARIHVSGEPDSDHELVKGEAVREVDDAKVEWWAELLGEREAQLAVVGDPQHPFVELGTVSLPAAGVVVTSDGPRAASPLRRLSYVAFGVGAAALAVSVVFGVRAATEAAQLRGVERDATGTVTSITQRDAFALNATLGRDGAVANLLFVTTGLVLALGITLFLLGTGAEP